MLALIGLQQFLFCLELSMSTTFVATVLKLRSLVRLSVNILSSILITGTHECL